MKHRKNFVKRRNNFFFRRFNPCETSVRFQQTAFLRCNCTKGGKDLHNGLRNILLQSDFFIPLPTDTNQEERRIPVKEKIQL